MEINFDSQGYKWIVSRDGFTKYDGKIFNTYSQRDLEKQYPELYLDLVYDIAVKPDEEIWAAAGNSGLLHFANESWDTVDMFSEAVEYDHNGLLWCQAGYSDYGIYSYDGNEWQHYRSELPSMDVTSIAVDNQNNKWIGTEGGLAKFDGIDWTSFGSNDGLSGNHIIDIYINPDNNDVWVSTGDPIGVSHFNGTTWQSWRPDNTELPDNWLGAIAVDKNNVAWLGFYGGRYSYRLAKYDGNEWTVMDTSFIPEGYPNATFDYVYDIEVDDNNNKWIAANGDGVFIYNKNGVIVKQEEQPQKHVSSYKLYQNYPNPFNPTTTIKYKLKN